MSSIKHSFWLGLSIGFFLGGAVGTTIMSAKAFDPCEKPKTYDRTDYYIAPYNEREDAAMQYHWSEHQPSLHPK